MMFAVSKLFEKSGDNLHGEPEFQARAGQRAESGANFSRSASRSICGLATAITKSDSDLLRIEDEGVYNLPIGGPNISVNSLRRRAERLVLRSHGLLPPRRASLVTDTAGSSLPGDWFNMQGPGRRGASLFTNSAQSTVPTLGSRIESAAASREDNSWIFAISGLALSDRPKEGHLSNLLIKQPQRLRARLQATDLITLHATGRTSCAWTAGQAQGSTPRKGVNAEASGRWASVEFPTAAQGLGGQYGRECKPTSFPTLFSDSAGILGLYMGISVLTLCEMAELCLHIVTDCSECCCTGMNPSGKRCPRSLAQMQARKEIGLRRVAASNQFRI
uniref:Uncharacterized protein n=1 Tax=Macrostomum lignano TaxID=282301 RepID=A0A1I8FBB7_9PLAT